MGSTWGSLLLPVNASQLFNMKSMILIAVFLAVAAAAPQDNRPILIVKQSEPRHGETSVLVQLRDRERNRRQRERSPDADRSQTRRVWNRVAGQLLFPRR